MIVFKCYMKILRQNVTLVIIYLGIFFSVALVMQMAAGKSEDSLYANTSIDIGVVKEDQGVLAQGFVDYLNTIHNVIPMKNNPEVLQENLFYRNVEYIVQIPDDFYEACIQGNQPLKVTKVPGSYSSYYVDQQISSYISTLRTYLAAGFSPEEAIQGVKNEVHEPVTKLSSDSASSDLVPYTYYFRYVPYLFLAVLCYSMGYILLAFQKEDIQKRMQASSVSTRRQNLEGLLAMFTIGVGLWLIAVTGAIVMYQKDLLASGVLTYYLLNTFVMMKVSLSLSYLLGLFVKNSNMLNGLSNIVSLGMCFLSGVFVPMSVMDKKVLKIAQFLPVYWYEDINETLARYHSVSGNIATDIWKSLGIEVMFALAFVAIILALSKYKRQK